MGYQQTPGFSLNVSDGGQYEGYNGTSFVDGTTTKVFFVPVTSSTGSASLPSGNEAQRDVAAVQGYTRQSTQHDLLETFDGSVWYSVGSRLHPMETTERIGYVCNAGTMIFDITLDAVFVKTISSGWKELTFV